MITGLRTRGECMQMTKDFALILILILSLVGCKTIQVGSPAKNSFSTGKEFYTKGSWEEAIPYFEKATQLAPENTTYQELLNEAKRKASQLRYESGTTFFQAHDLNRALVEYDRAVALSPDHKKAQISRLQTRQLRDEMAEARDEAVAFIKNQQWAQATERLQPILRYNKTFPDVKKYYAQARTEQGDQLFIAQNFSEAKAMYESALKALPTFDPARTGLKKAKREDAKRLYVKGRKDFHEGRLVSALRNLRAVHRLDPDYPNLKPLLADVTQKVARKIYDSGQALEQQGQDVIALVRYEEALKLAPSLSAAKAKVEELKRLTDKRRTYKLVIWPFISQDNDLKISERFANELIQLEGRIDRVTLLNYREYKARSIDPRRQIRADGHLKGKIVRFSVTEQPVQTKSRSKRYQSGIEEKHNPAYDRLVFDIEELEKRYEEAQRNLQDRQEKERRINGLERDRRSLEREIKNGINELERMTRRLRALRGQPGREEEFRRTGDLFDQESARLRGLHGQMKNIKDEINDLRRGPGLFALEREYDRAKSRLAYAKRSLLDTPKVLEEPTYEDYNYEVYLHSIRSYGEVQYQIDDKLLDEALVRRTVRVELNEEDEEIVEDHARAGINTDPKELPEKDEMLERTFQGLLKKIITHITEDLQQGSSRYLRLAERELARGNRAAAINEALYYFRTGGHLDPLKWEDLILHETAFSIIDRTLHLKYLNQDNI